jgi:hypothetical protein
METMSLRSLLTISRTVVPAADRTGRYRLANARLRRKVVFAGAKDPTTGRSPEPAPAASGMWSRIVGSNPRPTPFTAPGVPRSPPVARPRTWRFPSWVEQFVMALVRPGNRRRGRRPVQTELCFQSVKVARNDLMTADVEVVMGKPARTRARPGMSAACRARVLRLWWTEGIRRLRQLGGTLF